MPTISAGALKRMLHLPADVVIGTPRVERDRAGREIVVVPVRPYARDTGRCAECGGHGRLYDRLPRDDGGISTSAARGFSWSTRRDGVVSADSWDARTDRERTILTASAPLVQPRVRVLGEVAGMVGSLLSTDGYLEPDADARKQLKDSAVDVLAKAIAALEGVDEADWATDALHDLLTRALVDEGGYKPRLAFGPVRVALSGRRVSPPLFESMEIIGKDVTLARLKGLAEHL